MMSKNDGTSGPEFYTVKEEVVIDGIRIGPGDRILVRGQERTLLTKEEVEKYFYKVFGLGLLVGSVAACAIAALISILLKVWF